MHSKRCAAPAPGKHRVVAVDLMADSGFQKLADTIDKFGNFDIMVHNLGGSPQIQQVFAPTDVLSLRA